MSAVTSIRLPKDLKKRLKAKAHLEHRSFSNQVEVSLRLALVAEENPDLPLQFIKDILQAKAEKDIGLSKPFEV